MASRNNRKETCTIPYIGEKFFVMLDETMIKVTDLTVYGPATHAFYHYGKVCYIRAIQPISNAQMYERIEAALAEFETVIHFCECR